MCTEIIRNESNNVVYVKYHNMVEMIYVLMEILFKTMQFSK